ncbi:MAG: hypothetical protein U5J96_05630 [Ignavibacteriaceae bacterium]|nr:hypothetical protein [Ignavibacteriaceae bacterium]
MVAVKLEYYWILCSYQDIYSIHFPSSQVGYVGSQGNAIYKTTDGGTTWVPIPVINTVKTLYFLDINTGYVGCDDNNVGKTTDGGLTWTWFPLGFWSSYSIFFLDNNTGYVAGAPGYYIVKTTDGGSSWNYHNTNVNYKQFANSISRIK